jgi:hypothetical protein
MLRLAGCVTDPSDGSPCPPVVAYSREFLARAADELYLLLPLGSAIEQMLAATKSCGIRRVSGRRERLKG